MKTRRTRRAAAWFALAAVIATGHAAPAISEDELETVLLLDELNAAESAEDRRIAFDLIVERAESGETFAMTVAGLLHMDAGTGWHDADRGIEWLQRAANRGDTTASWELAQIYSDAKKSPTDPQKAMVYALQTAEGGHAGAAFLLYQLTLDTPDNAIPWLVRSAERGHVVAARALGAHYAAGRGVPKDPAFAYFWLTIAHVGGDSEAGQLRKQVAETLSAARRRSLDAAVSEWRPAGR